MNLFSLFDEAGSGTYPKNELSVISVGILYLSSLWEPTPLQPTQTLDHLRLLFLDQSIGRIH